MTWNPRGMEPGGEPPDYAPPYSPQHGPAGEQGWPPGYGPPPGYGSPIDDAPPGYRADPRYAPDADAWQPEYGPQDADADEEPDTRGRTVTPLRLVAFIALVVSGAVAAVSLLVLRGSQSIAITVASLAIFGLMATLIGVAFAAAGVRAARYGSLGRAFLGGLFGGLFVLVASGAVASAVIFVLLSRP